MQDNPDTEHAGALLYASGSPIRTRQHSHFTALRTVAFESADSLLQSDRFTDSEAVREGAFLSAP